MSYMTTIIYKIKPCKQIHGHVFHNSNSLVNAFQLLKLIFEAAVYNYSIVFQTIYENRTKYGKITNFQNESSLYYTII